ncbi:hypothetical protein HN592_02275 [Candidatus Woesearchaeota archaeon]|jgi:hypothetical protein|nr:hypothetical protein [Candidatus Woesearchaeota archaeon]MBT4368038.1 hypothetical protein [Candidatus Woesearchaeota archaeon]MBT4712526.1 hypothetical protein [Candidatus Woesearchaeota archaeon]MBT6639439.1 hypothetical protein [Candidatus Woesearchaeota archaeon]MBT7133611.1 hypothetical protein [Candidatus Woesearchaeota archaeon]
MIKQILLTRQHCEQLAHVNNEDIEFNGFGLLVRTSEDIAVVSELELVLGEENSSVGWNLPTFMSLWQKNPEKYSLIMVHTHSRRYGDVIRKFDPYWSVSRRNSGHKQGTVLENRFYISKHLDSGDNVTMKYGYENGLFETALLVHPVVGSEGEVMTPAHVRITAYAYDPASLGNVKGLDLVMLAET